MEIEQLKRTLSMFGIKHLEIRFDPSDRQIVARFLHAGKQYEKIVTFAEIEQAFSEDQT